MDSKNIKIGIGFIIIALFVYIIFTIIKQNNIDKKLNKIETEQVTIVSNTDSLITVNKIIDSLNKIDGTGVKKVKENISKIDTIVNHSSLTELQKLLYKNLYK